MLYTNYLYNKRTHRYGIKCKTLRGEKQDFLNKLLSSLSAISPIDSRGVIEISLRTFSGNFYWAVSYKNWGILLEVLRNAVEANGGTLEKLGHPDYSTDHLREPSWASPSIWRIKTGKQRWVNPAKLVTLKKAVQDLQIKGQMPEVWFAYDFFLFVLLKITWSTRTISACSTGWAACSLQGKNPGNKSTKCLEGTRKGRAM